MPKNLGRSRSRLPLALASNHQTSLGVAWRAVCPFEYCITRADTIRTCFFPWNDKIKWYVRIESHVWIIGQCWLFSLSLFPFRTFLWGCFGSSSLFLETTLCMKVLCGSDFLGEGWRYFFVVGFAYCYARNLKSVSPAAFQLSVFSSSKVIIYRKFKKLRRIIHSHADFQISRFPLFNSRLRFCSLPFVNGTNQKKNPIKQESKWEKIIMIMLIGVTTKLGRRSFYSNEQHQEAIRKFSSLISPRASLGTISIPIARLAFLRWRDNVRVLSLSNKSIFRWHAYRTIQSSFTFHTSNTIHITNEIIRITHWKQQWQKQLTELSKSMTQWRFVQYIQQEKHPQRKECETFLLTRHNHDNIRSKAFLEEIILLSIQWIMSSWRYFEPQRHLPSTSYSSSLLFLFIVCVWPPYSYSNFKFVEMMDIIV
jgi:hypothetical protein